MKRLLIVCLIILPIILFSYFLEQGGIRNAALGETGIASSNDISASVWNPALMAKFDEIELLTDSRKYFWNLQSDDFAFNFAAVSYPFGKLGNFAFSGSFFDAAEYQENKLAIHYANKMLSDKFLYGVSFNSYGTRYGQNEYTINDPFFADFGYSKQVFDFDIGLYYKVNKDVQIGFTTTNIKRPNLALDEDNVDKLPLKFGAGINYIYENFTTIVDVKYELFEIAEQNNILYAAGCEYKLYDFMDLRFGVNKSKITAGFGLTLLNKNYTAKYAHPLTSKEYLNTRAFKIALDYTAQYPYSGIVSSYGDHFIGIKINYSNSTTEIDKFRDYIPPQIETEYVLESEIDSLMNEKVDIDTTFFKYQTEIDTVFIEKTVIDTVFIEVAKEGTLIDTVFVEKTVIDTIYINIAEVDTVYITKTEIDTVRIFSGVRDSVYLQKVRELSKSQSELKNLKSSNKAHVHLLNSLKFYYAGRYSDAINECKTAINIAPELALAYIRLGSIYFKTGNLEEAKANYQKAYRLDPTNSELKTIDPRFLE
jgi:tetratricopeptide (TPR) repeat protein